MKRPHLITLLALLFGACAASAEQKFTAGEHYERIRPAQVTQSGDTVEVLELFWYGCPHCYAFEPHLKEWLQNNKPDNMTFRRAPAIFAKNWLVHARAYYAAEAIGVLEQLHEPLFRALHEERRRLVDDEALIKFAASQGINEAEFRAAFRSFGVDRKVRQAIKATRDYGIDGVPSLIVNGKYRTSPTSAGGYDAMIKVAEDLVAKENSDN